MPRKDDAVLRPGDAQQPPNTVENPPTAHAPQVPPLSSWPSVVQWLLLLGPGLQIIVCFGALIVLAYLAYYGLNSAREASETSARFMQSTKTMIDSIEPTQKALKQNAENMALLHEQMRILREENDRLRGSRASLRDLYESMRWGDIEFIQEGGTQVSPDRRRLISALERIAQDGGPTNPEQNWSPWSTAEWAKSAYFHWRITPPSEEEQRKRWAIEFNRRSNYFYQDAQRQRRSYLLDFIVAHFRDAEWWSGRNSSSGPYLFNVAVDSYDRIIRSSVSLDQVVSAHNNVAWMIARPAEGHDPNDRDLPIDEPRQSRSAVIEALRHIRMAEQILHQRACLKEHLGEAIVRSTIYDTASRVCYLLHRHTGGTGVAGTEFDSPKIDGPVYHPTGRPDEPFSWKALGDHFGRLADGRSPDAR